MAFNTDIKRRQNDDYIEKSKKQLQEEETCNQLTVKVSSLSLLLIITPRP